ncbi:MAG TPA: quinolinate synthase NadA [Clostridiales bacterium]|nr:quinolinate synthase NadA [Clostridiales bacterium]
MENNNLGSNLELKNKIMKLKKEKKAVLVAHTYQRDEVQEIADMVGDSFALSKYCASSNAEVVVFCGVHFMAESAKILSPQKTILLPEKHAGCPMADMVTAEALREFKKNYPNAAVVCYINSSADVKAECDICCTSSNAVKVIKSLKEDEIIFVPDKNLGAYIGEMVPEKKMILWEGYCPTHHKIRPEDVEKARELHPDAVVLVHPECRPEVFKIADFVGSTKQIIDYATKSEKRKFIIGTEMGVLYSLKKNNPDKTFYMLANGFICPNMKKTTLSSIYNSLNEMKYNIELDDETIKKASQSLERMLEIS